MKISDFRLFKLYFAGFMLLLTGQIALSQTLEHKGLLSGWMTVNTKDISKPQLGLRYLPEFSLTKSLSDKTSLDLEFSLNSYGSAYINSLEDIQTNGKIKPYRMWARFSTSRFEARIGLQKINFGSASLLRPLMWFDSIDPRDPLQLTDGVYGLLLRYYFLNNTNIWFWGLYGNNNLKGWEFLPSKKNSFELGGRLQMPLGNGELGFTYHHRKTDPSQSSLVLESPLDLTIPENRYAIDGKWDIGIGIWFEGSLTHQESEGLPFPWQRALNIGLDYTFGLGNGLTTMGEHFFFESSRDAFSSGEGISFSALSLNYPLGLFDSLGCIFYYDWKNTNLYSFLNWRRTYDQWMINIIGFWNPERFQIYQNQPENNLFAGKGIQIMVIFNY
ncbi:hypothetical protein ACFLT9_03635 [Acidobacteriota bacterium]